MVRSTVLVAAVVSLAPPVFAAEDAAPAEATEPVEEAVEEARQRFREGTRLAGELLWAEALAEFEAADALHPHASTAFNLGVCHRARGRYTRAQATFREARRRDQAADELSDDQRGDLEAFLREIDSVLGHLDLVIDPPTATLTVDGRPLKKTPTGLLAGMDAPGRGRPLPRGRGMITVDPGVHVLVLSQKGFGDAVVRLTVDPGETERQLLVLERLPGTLQVRANEPLAAVSVDGLDVGIAPVKLSRPAGSYHVAVRKDGYDPYEADVKLGAAEEIGLMARLQPEGMNVLEAWWFWTAIAGTVASVAVTTWAVTRPAPPREPLDGGTLDWGVRIP